MKILGGLGKIVGVWEIFENSGKKWEYCGEKKFMFSTVFTLFYLIFSTRNLRRRQAPRMTAGSVVCICTLMHRDNCKIRKFFKKEN
jgi:hypothetical protein